MPVDSNSTTTATVVAVTVSSTASATTTVTTVTSIADTAAAMVTPSRPLTSPQPSSRPISPNPQPPQPHPHQLQNALHYPSQALYTAQPLPIRIPNPHPNSQLTKPHDSGQGVLYPVASSGRGFIPKGICPLSTDQTVTVASPGGGGYPPPSLVYPHGVRAMGSPHLDYLNQSLMNRPASLQYPHLGSAGAAGVVKGVPVSSHPKAALRSTISDSNGYKDTRERSRDETFIIIGDRKVKITEDASLYALCRSWLRNGIYEECQPQQNDVIKALPKPLPALMVAGYVPKKTEEDEEEGEDEKSVENLRALDILRRHIKRSKTVRARLREGRLQRITRYRNRLRLLLPPPVEQFRNDKVSGN